MSGSRTQIKTTMRKTFQKWLLLFVLAAFFVTFVISYLIQTKMASEHARTLIRLKLEDVKRQLRSSKRNLDEIRSANYENAVIKAKYVSLYVKSNPDCLNSADALQKVAGEINVDDVYVTDGKGIIVAHNKGLNLGYDMNSQEQSRFFVRILENPELELVQEPSALGANQSEIRQFSAVARLDSPGLVQVGYTPERLARAERVASVKLLADTFRIGRNGGVIVCDALGYILSMYKAGIPGRNVRDLGIPFDMVTARSEGVFDVTGSMPSVCAFVHFDGYFLIGMIPKDEVFHNRNSMCVTLIFIYLILFGAVFAMVSYLVQQVVINGIYKVNHVLEKITSGNRDVQVDIRTNEEFNMLSNGINATVGALKAAMSEISRRLDSELYFARAIQHASLPRVFPPFPEHSEFSIYAKMETAKEVGGDFYDFFLIDSSHLGFVIADVSGKGIPAALFMMSTKTLMKSYAEAGLTVSGILTEANGKLCENNEANMFVTVFLGILDTGTGHLTYSNAGHNPPLIKRRGGTFVEMDVKPGFVLGGLEDFVYESGELTLAPGESLFLYTDGVTEALNPEGEEFTVPGLLACLEKIKDEQVPERIVTSVSDACYAFVRGADRADDITMLVLTYNGVPQK